MAQMHNCTGTHGKVYAIIKIIDHEIHMWCSFLTILILKHIIL